MEVDDGGVLREPVGQLVDCVDVRVQFRSAEVQVVVVVVQHNLAGTEGSVVVGLVRSSGVCGFVEVAANALGCGVVIRPSVGCGVYVAKTVGRLIFMLGVGGTDSLYDGALKDFAGLVWQAGAGEIGSGFQVCLRGG